MNFGAGQAECLQDEVDAVVGVAAARRPRPSDMPVRRFEFRIPNCRTDRVCVGIPVAND